MNKDEVLRYMRTSSKTKDEAILSLADEAIEKIESVSQPKTLLRVFDCAVGEEAVEIGGYAFKSKALAENLRGCKKAAVFGATLGIGVDRSIKLAVLENLSFGMALQAAAAEKIEEVCDGLEEEIKKQYGFKLRSRFSPGYYDLDISEQKKVFAMLELTKRIGITLSESLEMMPSKSVTAIIGIEN
ncbi:MAG: Vitamin B12 dependent methionine synthase activation subunit [Eubacterium sp.]|nr:Vitamin B12 dependent methionine synthase activation subunit [Eubacterium sp.]